MNIDSLKHISQIHRQQYIERRGWEWRVFLTEITALVLAVPFIIKEKQALQGTGCLFVIFFCFSAFLSIWYLSWIHAASNKDKNYAQEAENLLWKTQQELDEYITKYKSVYNKANKEPANPISWKYQFIGALNGTWSFKFQAGIILSITFIVSVAAIVLI
ncbi:MAG: hypothetical protein ABSB25_09335 [Sedimentisphaerales bacterium]|jgi:hypothetical protein